MEAKGLAFPLSRKRLGQGLSGKLLDAIRQEGWKLPDGLRDQDWVVSCKEAGSGEPALKYLSRYLYRGIIAEKRIVENRDGKVSFLYRESHTKAWKKRTLPGEDFLWLVLQHVLPRGFRRVRDFGFLHGNAKKTLGLVQLLLHAKVTLRPAKSRPGFHCPDCGSQMEIIAVCQRPTLGARGPPLSFGFRKNSLTPFLRRDLERRLLMFAVFFSERNQKGVTEHHFSGVFSTLRS